MALSKITKTWYNKRNVNIQKKISLAILCCAVSSVGLWSAWTGVRLLGQIGPEERIRDIIIREQGDTAFITFKASPYLCYSVRRNGGNIGTVCGAEQRVTAQMEYVITPDRNAQYQFCEIQSDLNREPVGCVNGVPTLSLTKEETVLRSVPPEILDIEYDNKVAKIRYRKSDDLCYSPDGKRSRVYSASVPGVYDLPLCDAGESVLAAPVGAMGDLQTVIKAMQGKYSLKLCALYEGACSKTAFSDPREDFLFDANGPIELSVIENGLPYAPVNYVLGEFVLNYTKYSAGCVDLYGIPNSTESDASAQKRVIVRNICKNGKGIPVGFSFANIPPELYNPAFMLCYPNGGRCGEPVLPDYFAIRTFCSQKQNTVVCDQIGGENLYVRNQDKESYRGPLNLKENEQPVGASGTAADPGTQPPLASGSQTASTCPEPSTFAQLEVSCATDNDCPRIAMPSECTIGTSGTCESIRWYARCDTGTCQLTRALLPCESAMCTEGLKPAAGSSPQTFESSSSASQADGVRCEKNTDCGGSTCDTACSDHDGVCAKDCVMPLCMDGFCTRGNVVRICPDAACS